MIYRTDDGKEYKADTTQELVQKMRMDAFMEVNTDQEFMKDCAERIKLHRVDAVIDTTDTECFVNSLVTSGILKRV
jgi:hypothetical protein